jgi:hypothetical protein
MGDEIILAGVHIAYLPCAMLKKIADFQQETGRMTTEVRDERGRQVQDF